MLAHVQGGTAPLYVHAMSYVVPRHTSPITTDGRRAPPATRIAGEEVKHTIRVLARTHELRIRTSEHLEGIHGQRVQQAIAPRSGSPPFCL